MQALQLRPSLAHLDRERESAAAAKKKGKEEEEEQKPPELMALTVQVGTCKPPVGIHWSAFRRRCVAPLGLRSMLAALLGQPCSSRALCRLLLPGSGLARIVNNSPTVLPLFTPQVKRRETEQQTEARLRSYAHLAAQEEADQWVPLEFHGETSGALFQTVCPAS